VREPRDQRRSWSSARLAPHALEDVPDLVERPPGDDVDAAADVMVKATRDVETATANRVERRSDTVIAVLLTERTLRSEVSSVSLTETAPPPARRARFEPRSLSRPTVSPVLRKEVSRDRASVGRLEEFLRSHDPDVLLALLAEDVTFYSPIVFTPQRGREVTAMYLMAASATFPGDSTATDSAAAGSGHSFHYTKEVVAGHVAVLEFETSMGGKYVNGVDIITANNEGLIEEFRVMIRPLQAVNLIHERMGAALERMKPASS
jgi:hypothetical protein